MCKKDIETKIMLARECNQVFLNYRDFYQKMDRKTAPPWSRVSWRMSLT